MLAVHGNSLRGAVRRWGAAALLAGFALLAPGAEAAQDRIGVDTAVNPEASATLPGSNMRRMVLGEDVVYNERIVTGGVGQTQVLFVDQSAMSIGPNSDLVIDRFVYDPHTKAGQLAASLTRGVFRFVGGELSKHGNQVAVKTPAATIGIRGGVFLLDQHGRGGGKDKDGKDRDGKLGVVFVFGDGLTVTGTNGVSQTITRPGFEVVVNGPGSSPSSPFPASLNLTGNILTALDGHPGANGGATTVPTDSDVTNSGLPVTVSGNIAGSIADSQGHHPPPQPPTTDVGQLSTQFQQNTSGTPTSTSSNSPSPPPPPPSPPVVMAGGFSSAKKNPPATGYTTAKSYSGGVLSNGVFVATIGNLGTVEIPLAAGFQSFGPAGTASPLGAVTGSSFLAPDGTFFYADLTPVSAPNAREFIYGGQPVNSNFYAPTGAPRFFAFNIAPDNALQSAIPFLRQQTGGLLNNPLVSPLFIAAPANANFAGPLLDNGQPFARFLQASLAIDGQGAGQSSAIVLMVGNALATSAFPSLQGQIAGSFLANGASQPIGIGSFVGTPADGNGVSFYGGNNISGFVLAGTAGEQTAGSGPITPYNFEQPAIAASLPAGVGASQTTQTLSGFFGGVMTRQTGSPVSYAVTGTASVSTDATSLRVAAALAGADPFTVGASGVRSMNLNFGGLIGGTGLAQAYIDDNLYAALQSPNSPSQVNGNDATGSSVWIITSDVLASSPLAAMLPSGAAFCQCQYLKWGFWGGDLASNEGTRIDTSHINTWVAGQPTVTLPTSGTGSYQGALVGTVNNNGNSYLAAGGLKASYDFGAQRGTFNVNGYDGKSFTSTMSALSGGQYNAPIAFASNGQSFSGNAAGGFFGPGAVETGGNFAFQSISGTSYFTAGIFAAGPSVGPIGAIGPVGVPTSGSFASWR